MHSYVADKTLTSELHYGVIYAHAPTRGLLEESLLDFRVAREDVHGERFFPASVSKLLNYNSTLVLYESVCLW